MMPQGHAPDHATVREYRPEKYCSLLGFLQLFNKIVRHPDPEVVEDAFGIFSIRV